MHAIDFKENQVDINCQLYLLQIYFQLAST